MSHPSEVRALHVQSVLASPSEAELEELAGALGRWLNHAAMPVSTAATTAQKELSTFSTDMLIVQKCIDDAENCLIHLNKAVRVIQRLNVAIVRRYNLDVKLDPRIPTHSPIPMSDTEYP